VSDTLQLALVQLEVYVTELESKLTERISRLEKALRSLESPANSGQGKGESGSENDSIEPPDLGLGELCGELVRRGIEEAERRGVKSYPLIISLVEKRLIEIVLTSCSGFQTRAAEKLGINRNTLHKKVEEYRISVQPETS
jgi:DNA-binding NtrC family response regulator